VTDAFARTIDVKPDAVWVLIEEYEKENWAAGGGLYSDRNAVFKNDRKNDFGS
jgi:phenylpyruvate tautomerase PptA (4-oxalocrotonate tautomerase family)